MLHRRANQIGRRTVRNGRFVIPADRNHLDYWSSLIIPVVGIVFDPNTDSARWVDITAYLKQNAANERSAETIELNADNPFDTSHLKEFQAHFLSYRPHFGDDAHFAEALAAFAARDDVERCTTGVRSLFSFHRERPEAWYCFSLLFAAFPRSSIT